MLRCVAQDACRRVGRHGAEAQRSAFDVVRFLPAAADRNQAAVAHDDAPLGRQARQLNLVQEVGRQLVGSLSGSDLDGCGRDDGHVLAEL